MTRSSRGGTLPRRILVATAIALVPLVAGCEVGPNAPTLHWHQPTDGSSAAAGSITVSDAFVLGAPLNQSLLPGQSAGLYFGLTNTGGRDRLISVTAPGTAASVSLPGGAITVPPQRNVLLTGPRPTMVLENLTRQLTGGSVVTVVLVFQSAGTVRLDVPVMPRAQYYGTFSPAQTASQSASPSPSGTSSAGHHKKPHPTPTPSPTA